MSPNKKLMLKKQYERTASIEPFYTGGAIAMSNDGSTMACKCGGEVCLVDVATGKVSSKISADSEEVMSLALNPNGEEMISAGRDMMVKTWELAEGKKLRSWKAGQGNSYVLKMAYDETGTLAAGGCSDSIVRVWDAARGYATHNLRGHKAIITSIRFGPVPPSNPNAVLLYSGAEDGEVCVWSLEHKTCKFSLKGHDSAITALVLHPISHSLLTGGRDRVVGVWNTSSYKLEKSIPVFDVVEGLVLSNGAEAEAEAEAEEGRRAQRGKKKGKEGSSNEEHLAAMRAKLEFVTAGAAGLLKKWSVKTGSNILSEKERPGKIAYDNLLLHGPSQHILAVTIDQTLVFCNSENFQMEKQMIGYNEEVLDLSFASESCLAVCTNSDNLRIFDTHTRSCRLLYGHKNMILAVDCHHRHGVIATASKDQLVRFWHVSTGVCLGVAEGHIDAVGAVALAPKSMSFACSGSNDLTLKVWDTSSLITAAHKLEQEEEAAASPSPLQLQSLRSWRAHDKDINSVAVSPNDSLVASGSQDRTVKVWEATGELRVACKGHKRGVWCVKFSPVDKVVASSSADATVKLWSLGDGSCLKTLEGHEGSVLKLAFVTSGMQLVTGGSDGLLKLWTLKTSECVASLEQHEDKVWALAVAPGEDTVLATGGGDGMINFWDDVTGELEDKARKEQEETLELEQQMMNALRAKDYKLAAMLAFRLKKPFHLLQVLQSIITEHDEDILDEIIASFTSEQLATCLRYLRDWNTSARNSHTSQAVLLAILRSFTLDQICECEGVREIVDALVPYTQRHFQRLEDAMQRTYMLDFTLHAMRSVLGGSDQLEEDTEEELLQPWTRTRARRAAVQGKKEMEMLQEDKQEEEPQKQEEQDEGAAAMEGWGDWGSAPQPSDEDEEGNSENQPIPQVSSSSAKGKKQKKQKKQEEEEEEEEEGKFRTPEAKRGRTKPATTGKRSRPARAEGEDEEVKPKRKSLDPTGSKLGRGSAKKRS